MGRAGIVYPHGPLSKQFCVPIPPKVDGVMRILIVGRGFLK